MKCTYLTLLRRTLTLNRKVIRTLIRKLGKRTVALTDFW